MVAQNRREYFSERLVGKAAYLNGKHVKSRVRWQQGGETVDVPVIIEGVRCVMSIFKAIRYTDRLNRQRQKPNITIKPMIEAV
jgi:hypothetical protein